MVTKKARRTDVKMAGVSKNFIEDLRNSIDIVDLVSDYVTLKKAGKNYKGLCPFHQEKTPSFTVSPEKQFYHCFGCGAGGDAFSFLMEIEQITFMESLKILAQRTGMSLPNQSPYDRRLRAEREKIFEINQLTAKFYHYLLMEVDAGLKAREYLHNRGFTREDMEKFYLGYAPDTWRSLFKFLNEKGYQQEELIKAGVLISGSNNSYYDRFRDRIIFPIFNVRGEVLAFGGRIINNNPSSPKYLNSPDTPIYTKGKNLYGLNWAKSRIRETGTAIIMEGYTDVLTAHKGGITNAIASLGTALTTEQGKLLKRYASTVYIAYDADTAGAQATLRGLDILKEEGLKVMVVKLPEEEDPDEFISTNGQAGFTGLIKESIGLIDFKIEQLVSGRDLSDIDEKIDLTRQLIKLLLGIEDKIERKLYLEKIAGDFQLDLELLREELETAVYKDSKKKDKNYKDRYNKKDNKTNSLSSINRVERRILQSFIDNFELREYITGKLKPGFFSSNLRDLARVLWQNKDKTNQDIFSELEFEDLRSKFSSLTVTGNDKILSNKIEVENLILRLKEYRIYQNKVYILKQLETGDNCSLEKINTLLISYQQLVDNCGKEGF